MIAVRKVLFKDFINFKLEHLKYRGKRHKFYKIANSNIIYEFENNGKELIMKEFISDAKNKVYENEVYEYYKCVNDLFSTHKYYNGNLHRTDGPAITYTEDHKPAYYINGVLINEHFFNKIIKNLKRGRIENILSKYDLQDLKIIRSIVEEQGKVKDLEKVDNWIVIKKLEE